MSDVPDILSRFRDVRESGTGWTARCPVHDDQRSSLSLGHGEKQPWVFNCHVGCATEAILEAVGLTMADILQPNNGRQVNKPRIVATYDYTDEQGTLLYQVVRYAPKDFRQRRPNGSGGWIWKLGNVRRVIYRLNILHKRRPEALWVCEGENDVESLETLGLTATTNPGGASKSDDKPKWLSEYSQQLRACGVQRVCVLADRDDTGRVHAHHVARICRSAGIEARVLSLPNLREHGDVTDWIAAGGTKQRLFELAKSAPIWTMVTPRDVPAVASTLSVASLLSDLDVFIRRYVVVTDIKQSR